METLSQCYEKVMAGSFIYENLEKRATTERRVTIACAYDVLVMAASRLNKKLKQSFRQKTGTWWMSLKTIYGLEDKKEGTVMQPWEESKWYYIFHVATEALKSRSKRLIENPKLYWRIGLNNSHGCCQVNMLNMFLKSRVMKRKVGQE